jgi:hypothetical protein
MDDVECGAGETKTRLGTRLAAALFEFPTPHSSEASMFFLDAISERISVSDRLVILSMSVSMLIVRSLRRVFAYWKLPRLRRAGLKSCKMSEAYAQAYIGQDPRAKTQQVRNAYICLIRRSPAWQ